MLIKIVKHYSMYDPTFEGEIGFVTVEVPGRTGSFGAPVDPIIQKFDAYGHESSQLDWAIKWVDGFVEALGKPVQIEFAQVADDEVDRP